MTKTEERVNELQNTERHRDLTPEELRELQFYYDNQI